MKLHHDVGGWGLGDLSREVDPVTGPPPPTARARPCRTRPPRYGYIPFYPSNGGRTIGYTLGAMHAHVVHAHAAEC